MAYCKINDLDVSRYVNELKVGKQANYNAQTNAAGDTVVDLINFKRTIEVGFIPLKDTDLRTVLAQIDGQLAATIHYRDPVNGALSTVNCMVPKHDVEYYTIQVGNVSYKTFTLTFTEL